MSTAPAAASSAVAPFPAAHRYPRLPVVLIVAAIVLGIAIRADYFEPGIARTPDERTYTRQASIVMARGIQGFRLLGQELAKDPSHVSLYPSPLRVGYITLLMEFMRLTGDTSILAGARLSFLCSIIALALIAFSAMRFLSPTVAMVATLFYAVFPFDLTVFRRTWQESLIAMLTIATLSLAASIARTRFAGQIAGLAGSLLSACSQ